jgi:probable F420-dependent oxidoreductase
LAAAFPEPERILALDRLTQAGGEMFQRQHRLWRAVMDIGILIAATADSGDLAEIARLTESLGYDSLWIPEHPVIPAEMKTPFPAARDGKLPDHYARWADPFIALTVAATVTKKIKLGTGICLLPEREPLMTAKVIASLDLYSGGRVIIGAGAGWLREETELMGTKFGLRWKRMRETVEAMRALWTKSEASYQGDLVRFPAVRCEPKPVQKPYPPVLLGAHGPKALERDPDHLKRDVATIRKLAADHGRKPDSLQITAIVDPRDNGPSADEIKQYRDAGASRLVLFSQKIGVETAAGKAPELIRKFAPVIERAQKV